MKGNKIQIHVRSISASLLIRAQYRFIAKIPVPFSTTAFTNKVQTRIISMFKTEDYEYLYIHMYLHRSGFFSLSVSLHFHKKIKRKGNRQLTTAYSTVSNTSGKTHLHVKRLGPKKKCLK